MPFIQTKISQPKLFTPINSVQLSCMIVKASSVKRSRSDYKFVFKKYY